MKRIDHVRRYLRSIGITGLLLLVSASSGISAIHASTTDTLFQITVDGAWVQGEGTSFQRNGTIMIPIRVLAESIGATVNWFPEQQKIIVSKGEQHVQFLVGSKQAHINNKEVEIKEPPEIREGNVFLPLRIAMESLGANIRWDATNHIAAIESALSPVDAKAEIMSIADKTITALKNKDFETLSNISSQEQGVRFVPYSYIDKLRNIVLSHEKIAEGFDNHTTYLWGEEDGTGIPISMTLESYYKRFVYSNDFANAPKVGYNLTLGKGNSLNNIRSIYPESIVVEYYFEGFNPMYEGMDLSLIHI